VCDGLGGLPDGDQASRLAVESVRKSLARAKPGVSLRTSILDGIESANQKLLKDCEGATTLAAIEIGGVLARPYHVGDSVVLHLSANGKMKWHSISHSPVGYAMASGILTEETAIRHMDRHLVSNMVGAEDMCIEIGPKLALAKGDVLLIASDGLCDNLLTPEISEAVRRGGVEKIMDMLSTVTLDRMESAKPGKPHKPDDCSIVLFQKN
jgi:serine/threonine protein phosphatase PrpC